MHGRRVETADEVKMLEDILSGSDGVSCGLASSVELGGFGRRTDFFQLSQESWGNSTHSMHQPDCAPPGEGEWLPGSELRLKTMRVGEGMFAIERRGSVDGSVEGFSIKLGGKA